MAKVTERPKYDLPNMQAVADETRPYTDPQASYGLAKTARAARAEGVARRSAR